MSEVFEKNKVRGERLISALTAAYPDTDNVLVDAMIDMRHASDMLEEDFEYILTLSLEHYRAETRDASEESEV